MQTASDVQIGFLSGHSEPRGNQRFNRLLTPHVSAFVLAVAAAVLFFIADVLLPRGATPAIGYALVPVLAVGSRSRAFMFWMAAVCTVLTWAGYFLEPPGGPWWMSVFERAMVTMVLWLTLLLIWRRHLLIAALAERSKALEQTGRELSRSNAELESFASVVAHDLRGPLNAMGLVAKLLGDRRRVTLDGDSHK